MKISICDGVNCNNALDETERLSFSADHANRLGWVEVRYVELVTESDKPPLSPEVDRVEGEVTIDGKACPFVFYKPKDVAEAEKALRDEWKPRPSYRHVEKILCPSCAPKMTFKSIAEDK